LKIPLLESTNLKPILLKDKNPRKIPAQKEVFPLPSGDFQDYGSYGFRSHVIQ
jgi:hypothetical protein